MLPEFLDDQGLLKPSLTLPTGQEELQILQDWLTNKELESNRQIRPAWIEVATSLCQLVQERMESGAAGVSALELEECVFETHLVARQAARQRQERSLPTRFVTDEIKRLSSHQFDCINAVDDAKQKVAVIGWYRLSSRRGLGIIIAEKESALELCNEALNHENQTEIDEYQNERHSDWIVRIPKKSKALVGFLSLFLAAGLLLFAFQLYSGFWIPQKTILSAIKTNNVLRCGVDGLLPHFSLRNDAEQSWWGLDVDLCKALGAALDVEVEFVKVSASEFDQRISALLNREVDILFRNTSHTVLRDLNKDIAFGPVYFYEKEYFLEFSSSMKSTSSIELSELNGKNICVKPGTSNERTLQQLVSEVEFELVTKDKNSDDLADNVKLLQALRDDTSLCDFAFGNYFVLKQLQDDQERRHPERNFSLRPFEKASLDPLAPVLLRDREWQRVVDYTIYALLYADQLNINSYNLEEKRKHGSAIEKQFLLSEGMEQVGLKRNWISDVISSVGSYNQIYYRAIVCDYVACSMPSEQGFYDYLISSDVTRWPNKVFKANDSQPGMLVTPSF